MFMIGIKRIDNATRYNSLMWCVVNPASDMSGQV